MPPPEDPETVVLQKIAATKGGGKSNTRWGIIAELAYELCTRLKLEKVTASDVAKKSRDYIKSLEAIFQKLAAEKKIELNLQTGEVKLTDFGKKALEELTQKTGPA